jgi:LPXTG-site transpeptidase (sortase) family protein
VTKKQIFKFLILRTIGNFMVLFAIFGICATFGPAIYYEISFKIVQARGVEYVIANAPKVPQVIKTGNQNANLPTTGVDNFAAVLAGAKQQVLVPKDSEFSIVIPKIGASSKVFADVDPADENQFLPILMKGVAHAQGSVFPGMKGNVYLFAHSTDNFWDVGRYNAVFYLLKDLKKGDEVVIFYKSVRHEYVVTDSKIMDPNQVFYLIKGQQNQEQLILQTCWPPGTTWQRLLIFAKPK